nr:PREDICTED: intraflagellar transport protein 122 homolog [Bemisia tabaci]
MRIIPVWASKAQNKDKVEQCIYSLCFNPDGSRLILAAGQKVLIYNADNGSLIEALKGHKENVYCVAYAADGRRFASGGSDKTVIIWTSKLEGTVKYTHNDSVQCLSYNPVFHFLASCAISDFAFWSADQKAVQKFKVPSRINVCSWTADGLFLALGLNNGNVSVRSQSGEEHCLIDRQNRFDPIYALAWCPIKDDSLDVLCITDWGKTLSFCTIDGSPVTKERTLDFEPLFATYFNDGLYLIVGGIGGKVALYSREGVHLSNLENKNSTWVWTSALRPNSSYIVFGHQDGQVACYQLAFNTIHALFKDRYAYRENMTDVIIHNLLLNQKVRIKCSCLVKKIGIYKHRLAVQLPERVTIYELYLGEPENMRYRVKAKINKQLDCTLLVVCSEHLIVCQEKRIESLNFDGIIEREWLLDSLIRYIRVIGGAPGKEGLLVGLKSGQVLKIFLDNPFPVKLIKASAGIRCLDLSLYKRKLAVVDENNQCCVYDLSSKEICYKEANAISVVWNSNFEDMLSFSGNGTLNLKVNNFPIHRQKLAGFVVGLWGSKVFSLNSSSIEVIEVPLSKSMYQYVEKSMFREAYLVACLGVTDSDWRFLAEAALEGFDINVAEKAYRHLRDFKHLDFIFEFQQGRSKSDKDKQLLVADIYAIEGKFSKAADLYAKCGQGHKALAMYSDLRMFDLAQEYLGTGDNADEKSLVLKRAEWAESINEHRAAVEMYLSIGEVNSAIRLMSLNEWVDMLVDIGRKLDKAETELIGLVAESLQKLGEVDKAAEMYSKLGELKNVVQLNIEARNWQEVFSLAEKHSEFYELAYLSYAQWLAENDKFIEAQKAFHKAGCLDEASKVLQILTKNAVNESRFQDAGYYYWVLSKQCLDIAVQNKDDESKMVELYHKNDKLASIYYAYHIIQRYMDEPFTSFTSESLFNIARYLVNETKSVKPQEVSQFAILYTLSKQAQSLGAYKLARQVLDRMQTLRIPPQFRDYVDMSTLRIRGKPYHDNDDLLIMCYRCSTHNPLQINSSQGNTCVNCRHPFVHSHITFEVLPLVQFLPEEGITDAEAMRLIETTRSSAEADDWDQQISDHTQALRPSGPASFSSAADPFTARLLMLDMEDESPVVTVNRETLLAMDPASVVICHLPPPLKYLYYRNLLPELQVYVCHSCFKIFHVDDYEMELLQRGHCPFCRVEPESMSTSLVDI